MIRLFNDQHSGECETSKFGASTREIHAHFISDNQSENSKYSHCFSPANTVNVIKSLCGLIK